MENKAFKILSFLFVFLLIGLCLSATESYIEDNSLTTIPKQGVRALRVFDNDYSECEYIGKIIDLDNNPQTSFWFVTTKDACEWGRALGPIWVLSESSGDFHIILSDGGYSLFIEDSQNNSLFDIKTSSGTAGWFQENLWRYNGDKYIKVVLKDDPKEKILLSVVLRTDLIEKSNDVLKIIEQANGKKKLKAYIKSQHRIEELSKKFSTITSINNVRFFDAKNSLIALFNADDNEWTVKYCWDISTDNLFFAAKKTNSKKIYYSKNLYLDSKCPALIKN